MSASKKKNRKKDRKLRVETTKNVLSKEEMEKRDKEKLEAEFTKEQESENSIKMPVMSESIRKLIEAADLLNSKDDSNNKEENNEVVGNSKDDSQNTKIVPNDTMKQLVRVEKESEDRPEYVKEMLARKRRRMAIFGSSVAVVVILVLFSTMFAIMNSGSTTIAKGVKIKDIDMYNLTKEEAKELLEEKTSKELVPEIRVNYGEDFRKTLKAEQLDFKYDIDKAVDDAYNIGKDGNIVQNNYSLLFSSIFGNNVKLDYSYNEELLDSFVEEVHADIPGVVVEPAYYREDDQLIVSKGIDGYTFDKDVLKKNVIEKIVKRDYDRMENDGTLDPIELKIYQTKAEKINMAKIYEEIHTGPKDAYYELEPYKLYPDVDGVDLTISVEEAQKQVDKEDKEEYSFKLNITKANVTVSDLGMEAFPYKVSEFSTKYDASNTNRSTNLKIAADKINGTVVMPGEEFSYNKVVGKRTVEEGYKDAKIYADGGVVDGLAGGICQISSTLYNAVLLANLEVTERHNHTYVTSYLPAGRDATVVWGTKDFKFKNTRNYPIKIEANVGNGIAEFIFHGIQEETEYDIKIIPHTTSSIPFSITYEDDPTLAPGQEITKQAGHAGYRVTTYKEVLLNDVSISKEVITTDTYSPMRKIVRRGPVVPQPGM